MLVVVAPDADPARVSALRDAGAEILVAAPTSTDAPSRDLGRREITSLFLEGGRTLASAFVAADQIDESRTFVAPVLLADGACSRGWPGAGGRDDDLRPQASPRRDPRAHRRHSQLSRSARTS